MAQTATILGPNGEATDTVPIVSLTQEEAELLRKYKKFLHNRGLKEALYCNACFEGNRNHGCEAHVTETQIMIRCRCRMRFYNGMTL